ncbi:MAG: ABC transporter ATP-binding protein [Clostridia bacterium]|nr:ABC transporter ATP-binding protein [Clostridia bacterium]
MEFAIKIEHLTKVFSGRKAVDDLSFAIKPGQIFGFLGPNGSGKSTTIRMLCGILTPTAGGGQVLGIDLKDGETIKQHIGYMSQKFSLYEDLTVEENMKFYGGVYGLDGEKLAERYQYLLDLAGLRDREGQLAGTLSGGWKQRLALACALLHRPRLLFLDEPTAGVDPLSRRIFWDLIHRLAQEGVTILVTTHYMDEAEQCDILGFIFQGRLLDFGTPGEIKTRHNGQTVEDIFINFVAGHQQEGVGL